MILYRNLLRAFFNSSSLWHSFTPAVLLSQAILRLCVAKLIPKIFRLVPTPIIIHALSLYYFFFPTHTFIVILSAEALLLRCVVRINTEVISHVLGLQFSFMLY